MSSVVSRSSDLDAERARLRALEAQLAERGQALTTLKQDLHRLQARYLSDVGPFYRELSRLEAEIVTLEVRLGLRPPPDPDAWAQDDEGEAEGPGAASCASPTAPSVDLKRVFRDVAKAIHPDLAMDEPARWRRHSLMAEANRAYAERDEDRLRLILQVWEQSAEAVVGEGPEAEDQRIRRRIAEVEGHLAAVEAEMRELRASAIWRLQGKIEEAKRQGWDLSAEMLLQVKRDVARARARLVSLQRSM